MTDISRGLVERFKGHTPGPWIAREGALSIRGNLWFIGREHGSTFDQFAEAYSPADARLISAAPRLLAALREAERALEHQGRSYRATQLEALNAAANARAAIAKATQP